jgi:hypothetical protein
MSDTDAVAHRLRLLDELHAEGVRAWGADFLALPLNDYRDALMCLALDRIHRGETRGFARRRPALPAMLDAARMKQGIG